MKFRSVKKPNPVYRNRAGWYWRCECGAEVRPYGYTRNTRKTARDGYWHHRKQVHGGLGDQER